jgi:hypothetical protein
MSATRMTIPKLGDVKIAMPSTFAARFDLITSWGNDPDSRMRLLWAVLGLCWQHPKKKLPQYRPERGDRDLYAYAAKVMQVIVGDWGLSPYSMVEVFDEEGLPVRLMRINNEDETEAMDLNLTNVGLLLFQQIQSSIPLPEEVDEAVNFTSPSEGA